MLPSRVPSQAASLPEALRPLAGQLAKLPEQERELVIAVARSSSGAQRAYPAMSWGSLMSASGVVSLGGNAVDDCDALYDG